MNNSIKEPPMPLASTTDNQFSKTLEWVIQSAYQAEYLQPPASIKSEEDTETDFDDDRQSSIGIEEDKSKVHIMPSAAVPLSKRKREGSEELVQKGYVTSLGQIDPGESDQEPMEEEGTVKGGERLLNKRDFRVIMTEIYRESELIRSEFNDREQDVSLAWIRLKNLQGFLEVVIDRIDQELEGEAGNGNQD